MEITYLIIGCFIGGILGSFLIYFYLKSSTISRKSYDELNHLNIKSNADLENAKFKIQDLELTIKNKKETHLQQSDLLNDLKAEFAKVSAENTFLKAQKEETKRIQEEGKLQFENLANKILEEKTEKFTNLNQTNLKNILEPFQERISDLKNKVNEVLGRGEVLQSALLPAMQAAQQLIKQSIAQELGNTTASSLFDAESHITEGLT